VLEALHAYCRGRGETGEGSQLANFSPITITPDGAYTGVEIFIFWLKGEWDRVVGTDYAFEAMCGPFGDEETWCAGECNPEQLASVFPDSTLQ
jgi:hypothetical protein